MEILGIDIGGSGIKGAIVNTETGELITERLRFATPSPATPKAVTKSVQKMATHFSWHGKIGCGFPAAIRRDKVRTASNIDKKWLGQNSSKLFSEKTNCPVNVINDADAAGIAEIKFGAGLGIKGVIIVITVGSGIGSALFIDGSLVPNTELGHLLMSNGIAEKWASDNTRKAEDLSWDKWAKRFNKYLQHVESLFWPDLFIIGGGMSKKRDKFMGHLNIKAEVVEARLLNNAGIIGAALSAEKTK